MNKKFGPNWDKYGLTLAWPMSANPAVIRGVRRHNLVATYLDEHPEEHAELFSDDGNFEYFEVLERAEKLYGYDRRENCG